MTADPVTQGKRWRRARSDRAKQERRQMLMDAALALFAKKRYEEIEVLDVARRAGVAKGTVYLYFPSKEALFLAVSQQQFEAWFDELDATYQGHPAHDRPDWLAAAFSDSVIRRPILVRLFAILHVVLEQNIDHDTALAFKRMLRQRLRGTGALLERCAPFLAPGEGSLVLLQGYALCIGMQNLANPAQVIKRIIAEVEGMEVFDIDFGTHLLAAMRALLRGHQGEVK